MVSNLSQASEKGHSIETVLLGLVSDVCDAIDSGLVTLLVLWMLLWHLTRSISWLRFSELLTESLDDLWIGFLHSGWMNNDGDHWLSSLDINSLQCSTALSTQAAHVHFIHDRYNSTHHCYGSAGWAVCWWCTTVIYMPSISHVCLS